MKCIKADTGERKAEHSAAQREAEAFLGPILPMLEHRERSLKRKGVVFEYPLLVGPYPFNAPENPVKAGLMVSIKGRGVRNGGTVYTLEEYMPDDLHWLAAEIEMRIEEHLNDPEFGSLSSVVQDMGFKEVDYDRQGDHAHCACCSKAIATEAPKAYVTKPENDPSAEIWLCPRCFDYWAPRRNLSLVRES